MQSPNERRQFVRHNVKSPAVLQINDGLQFDADVCDVSPSGLLLTIPAATKAPAGSGEIKFLLLGHNQYLKAQVEIKWSRPGAQGFIAGAEFISCDQTMLTNYWQAMPMLQNERVI